MSLNFNYTNYIEVKPFFPSSLFNTCFCYIDRINSDNIYNIDKIIPPNIFYRLKFTHEFIRDDFGPFKLCLVKVPKKFKVEFKEILDRLDNNLQLLYGSAYSNMLIKFNDMFSELLTRKSY